MFMLAIQPQVEHSFNQFNRSFVPRGIWRCDHVQMGKNAGSLLKERLRERKKTQTWLAEQVGVSNNAVSKWVQGGPIGKQCALKISRLLDIDIRDLIDDEGVDYALLPSANGKAGGHHPQSNVEPAPALGASMRVPVVGSAKLKEIKQCQYVAAILKRASWLPG